MIKNEIKGPLQRNFIAKERNRLFYGQFHNMSISLIKKTEILY